MINKEEKKSLLCFFSKKKLKKNERKQGMKMQHNKLT